MELGVVVAEADARSRPDPRSASGRAAIQRRLEAVRERTLSLVAGLEPATLRRQHVPILSPMVWDLGHIGHFEDLWLSRELTDAPPVYPESGGLFDAGRNPRSERDALALLEGRALLAYLQGVRERSLEILFQTERWQRQELARDGLVFELVAEHEEQHQETLLQALQILEAPAYVPAQRRRLPPVRSVEPEMIEIPAGPFRMGWSGPGFAYDNEMPAVELELPGFRIDRFPVTQGAFLDFVEAGGYRRRELWSAAGWAWRQETAAEAPANWRRGADGWVVRFMDRVVPLPERFPVVHVCYHEAEAYARFVGKRLPTEPEWEKAALWDEGARSARLYPWGEAPPSPERANLDQLAMQPAPVGAYPAGASAYGVEQMLGDVWEWTASDFRSYPGFRPFPYEEYSAVFFGPDYKVLRGGSWATRPRVARGTVRNWDFPVRRQIFAGFRCAASL